MDVPGIGGRRIRGMNSLSIPILAVLAGFAAVFLPRYGFLAWWRRARGLAARSQREDVLKHILKYEAAGRRPTLDSIAGALEIRAGRAAVLLQDLEEHGMVSFEEGNLCLKPAGREMALHIVRAHRLWESYLAEQTGVAEREWHQRAERQEHLLSPQEADALAARLGIPRATRMGMKFPSPTVNFPPSRGSRFTPLPRIRRCSSRTLRTSRKPSMPSFVPRDCAPACGRM